MGSSGPWPTFGAAALSARSCSTPSHSTNSAPRPTDDAACSDASRACCPDRCARGRPGLRSTPSSSPAGAARGSSSGASGSGARRCARYRDRDLLGAAGAWLRGHRRPHPARRPGTGGARQQSHGTDVHRRGSGNFLYAALHRRRAGLQPDARSRDDGMVLTGARITAVVRCAPPANKPTHGRTRPLPALHDPRVGAARGRPRHRRPRLVRLGRRAAALRASGHAPPRPRPRFGHGAEVRIGPYVLLGAFHPSQQNTFTGRLTAPMLEAVIRARRAAAGAAVGDAQHVGRRRRSGPVARAPGRRGLDRPPDDARRPDRIAVLRCQV